MGALTTGDDVWFITPVKAHMAFPGYIVGVQRVQTRLQWPLLDTNQTYEA